MFSQAFNKAAQWAAFSAGKGSVFVVALGSVVIWAATGPLFGYSQTWQLVINTGTTILTFLMVFLVQNTQNRDTTALQLKLDELIRVTKDARPAMLDLEGLPQEQLSELQDGYKNLARESQRSGQGRSVGGGVDR